METNQRDLNSKLLEAAQKGDFDQCVDLIKLGAEPGTTKKGPDMPIHIATRYGKIEIVKLLIEKYNVDVNLENRWGHTPLHKAAQSGHIDIINFLILEKGAPIDPLAVDGSTPAHKAAHNCRQDAYNLLVKLGADETLKTSSTIGLSEAKGKTPPELLKQSLKRLEGKTT